MGVFEEVECAVNAMQELESTVYKLGNRPVDAQWRKKMVKWMYHAADSVGVSRDLACLGTYYLDMLLAKMDCILIQKTPDIELATETRDLELASAICLFLAVKLKNSTPIRLEKILEYCQNLFTEDETKVMEAYILCELNYRTQPPTARSFHRQLIRIIPPDMGEESEVLLVHMSSLYFIDLATKNYSFTKFSGAIVASAAMVLVAQGMRIEFPFRLRLHLILDADPTKMHKVYQLMKEMFGDIKEKVNKIRILITPDKRMNQTAIPNNTSNTIKPPLQQCSPDESTPRKMKMFEEMEYAIKEMQRKDSLRSIATFDFTEISYVYQLMDKTFGDTKGVVNKILMQDTGKKRLSQSLQKISDSIIKHEYPRTMATFDPTEISFIYQLMRKAFGDTKSVVSKISMTTDKKTPSPSPKTHISSNATIQQGSMEPGPTKPKKSSDTTFQRESNKILPSSVGSKSTAVSSLSRIPRPKSAVVSNGSSLSWSSSISGLSWHSDTTSEHSDTTFGHSDTTIGHCNTTIEQESQTSLPPSPKKSSDTPIEQESKKTLTPRPKKSSHTHIQQDSKKNLTSISKKSTHTPIQQKSKKALTPSPKKSSPKSIHAFWNLS